MDPARLPAGFHRQLAPPPGGSARLRRSLASAAAPRRTARFPKGLVTASAIALIAVAAVPMHAALERHHARQQLVARLGAAIAEAGRPGPDVRIDGAHVQPVPSVVPGVQLYRVELATR
ncbi:MAG: hypothetical protein ACRC2H_05845 [Silanimonas sp.]